MPRLSGNRDGLYQCTFTLPYSQFTQTLAASTIKAVSPDLEDTSGWVYMHLLILYHTVPTCNDPMEEAF